MSITDTNIRALLLVANKHGVQKHSCIQISLNKMRWVTFEMNKPGDFLQQHNAYKLTDMTHHLWHCPESLRGLCVHVCACVQQLLRSILVFPVYYLPVLNIRVFWTNQHVDFCRCKIYSCRLIKAVSVKLLHGCYFPPQQESKLSWKYIAPRWRTPA